MEHPEKISCNFPKLSQFKGQPWSSLTTFLNETYTSKSCEDYGIIKNYVKKELDTEKTEMDTNDLARFHGQPWATWISSLDINALTNNAENENPDTRVTRLPRQDMGLFGICPENERFCAVVCSTCGAVVKAQALQRHLELKHTSDSETALLPPPQVPVKKTKTASVKMKSKESSTPSAPAHSSENVVPSFPPVVSVKQVESSTSTTSSTRTYVSEAYSHSARRKSPNINSDRKSQKKQVIEHKDKDIEPERNSTCEDSKQISRQLSSKSQSSTPRRSVTGRTKDFNKLVAEHRATKEQPSIVLFSSKSRPQSILKTVMTTSEADDSGFSSSISSQSSQSINQDPSSTLDSSPLQTSPPSPTLSLITSTCSDTPGTSSPTVNATFSCSDYLVNSGSSACSSPNIISSSSSNTDMDNSVNVNVSVPSSVAATVVSDSNDCAVTTTATIAATSTQLVQQVVPNNPSNTQTYTNAPSFTVKLPRTGSPIIILNNTTANATVKELQTPQTTAMLLPASSVNTESIANSNSTVPVMKIMSPTSLRFSQPQPVVVSRDVIESLNVPVVMEMPAITDSLSNITVYTTYPKPLVVTSTFAAKKIGHAVIVRNRRLELIRKKIKCLKIKKKINQTFNIAMKRSPHTPVVPVQVQMQSQGQTQSQSSSVSVPAAEAKTVTMFGVKTLNATTSCRFPKAPSMPSIQATSLLAHRPNILRTASPKHRERETTVPKILTTGLKRPASSSPQLAGLDCKHMLLKPTANNINVSGIIGKMIVHQHEMTDSHSSDGPTTNHITLDKVVPVNIK